MNTTSLEAYQAIESSGAATLQRQKVWIALRLFGAMTRQEVADQTGIKLSSICGRVRELEELGQVEVAGYKLGDSGVRNEVLRAVTRDEVEQCQSDLFGVAA